MNTENGTNTIPQNAHTTSVDLVVPFSDIDGMNIVHHANYACYLERARVAWIEAHDQPYQVYIAQGNHFAVSHLEMHYHQPARFADKLCVTAWLQWVHGASLQIAYALHRNETLLLTAITQHVFVDQNGKPRRIPKDRRESLIRFATETAPTEQCERSL